MVAAVLVIEVTEGIPGVDGKIPAEALGVGSGAAATGLMPGNEKDMAIKPAIAKLRIFPIKESLVVHADGEQAGSKGK